ncbi:MAG: PEP-CTERM sorting domain-containing protein [Cyanobacteria bacterium CAN_BIN43]|nr:PEP-CTERM sorting domain-containing protein [Cyanobacteria bacterium CAN_BIN43]
MGITKTHLGCAATMLSLSVGLPAQAAGFNFTQISDSVNSPFRIFRNAAVNNQGLVAFETFAVSQAPPIAVSAGSGGVTVPISDRQGPYNVTFYSSLNNTGTATFTGNLVDLPNIDFNGPPPADATITLIQSGIYANTGGVVNTIADRTSKEFNFFGSSAINDAGTIAFFASFGPGESGIFTSSDGKIAPVASTQGAFSSFLSGINTVGGDGPFTIYTVPGINNSGKIAFSASLDSGQSGVFISDGGTVKTIADTSSIFKRFSSAAINDQGVVAFVGELVNGDRALFTGTDQGLKTIVDTSGAFSFFNSDPALNNKGEVAFLAELYNGGKGIFTGADPIADKVVAVGDSINGLSVQDLIIVGKGLNDDGQVAFSAVLSDGSERIFRAKRVPEPGSIAGLAAIGLIGGWLKRHRRNSAA